MTINKLEDSNESIDRSDDDINTIGSQIQEKVTKYFDDKGPEAREVTLEWGKKFLRDLEEIVQNPKYKNWKKIYVKVLAKKPVISEHMVSIVYGITQFPPSPDWKNMLYSYDRERDEWKLEWVLPQAKEIARVMLVHEEGFDPFLIKCIKNFLDNKLLGQNYD